MRSKLPLLAAFMLVGCADDQATDSPVEDATTETFVVDTSLDSRADTLGDAGRDTATIDSATTDTASEAEVALDGSDTSTAVDTADAAVADTVDAAVADTVDAAVADTADAAVADTADAAVTDTADAAVADTADAAVADTADAAVADTADTSVVDASFASAPTCDGTVTAGEYGLHVEGKNQYTEPTASTTWYVTWDDGSLYVALAGANLAEAAILYVDANPLTPPTSGTNADGNIGGQTYDSTRFSTMPFRANLVSYAKDGYREYRLSDGTGGWSSATTSFGCYASSGTVREFSIPWSVLGGRPASFGFFAYVTTSGGFAYGGVPISLPDGNIGTTATATSYFNVSSTGPTATTTAFSDER
jgi:hypothetical protein